jgi:hypothetical protein
MTSAIRSWNTTVSDSHKSPSDNPVRFGDFPLLSRVNVAVSAERIGNACKA